MATPNLLKISKTLSGKIFDPVGTGDSDGARFNAELRLGYINRAYGDMIRTFEIIHPKLIKVFKNYYQIVPLEITNGAVTLEQNYDVFDIYYAEGEGEDQKRASYIEPTAYKTTEQGLSDFRKSSDTDVYWSIIDNEVKLLPSDKAYYNVEAICRNYFAEFTYNGDTDINIPYDYMDILILLAAIEAMSDTAEQAKYQIYTQILQSKLTLIAKKKQERDIKEEGVS